MNNKKQFWKALFSLFSKANLILQHTDQIVIIFEIKPTKQIEMMM